MLPSCDNSKAKYEYFANEISLSFGVVDALGASEITPDELFYLINDRYDKSSGQRTDDGIIILYGWKKDNKYTLSEEEDFYCCAMYDFNRNPNHLTLSNIGMVYESSSPDDVNMFYTIAMENLTPMMARWGFEMNEDLKTPTKKYFYKGSEQITIFKEEQKVTFLKNFP